MVGDIKPADCAEEDGVMLAQASDAVGWHHRPGSDEVVASPFEPRPVDSDAGQCCRAIEHAGGRREYLGAYAVAGNRGEGERVIGHLVQAPSRGPDGRRSRPSLPLREDQGH